MTFKLPFEAFPDTPAYNAEAHLAAVKRQWTAYPLKSKDVTNKHTITVMFDIMSKKRPWLIAQDIINCMQALYRKDGIYDPDEPCVAYRSYLDRIQPQLTNERIASADRVWGAYLRDLFDILPASAFEKDRDLVGDMSLPLYTMVDARRLTLLVHKHFLLAPYLGDNETFLTLRSTLIDNMIRASGLDPDTFDGKRKLVSPHEFQGAPEQLLDRYLANTPFLELFAAPLPFSIPLSSYREHGFLFAKSGHGKTQTMRTLLAALFREDCSIIILDGNGPLIKDLDRIEAIKDRLIILDPDDVPAFNFFKINGAEERQMELFYYLFRALDHTLTRRMMTMVNNLVQLMRVISDANLTTLRQVCETPAKDFPHHHLLKQLSPDARAYIENRFLGKDQLVSQTKEQVAERLHAIAAFPKLMAMFQAPESKFDAYRAMQEKKIVIVDTSRKKLGDDGSALFGRYILAQCLGAAWQRSENDHLALIVIDEAKTYLDEHSKKFLSDTRFFNVGLLIASQHPDQLDEGVRKEVSTNTTIKFAGPAGYDVVSKLNRDMRTSVEFIMGMKKVDRSHADWACYIDNMTPEAVRISVPFGSVEKLPLLSTEEHRALRAANKERLTAKLAPPRTPPSLSLGEPAPPQSPSEPSIKWTEPE